MRKSGRLHVRSVAKPMRSKKIFYEKNAQNVDLKKVSGVDRQSNAPVHQSSLRVPNSSSQSAYSRG